MTVASKPYYTPEEYLRLERAAETKSEYFNGEIFAMAGAKEAHVLITTNVVTELGLQLRGRPCRVYSNDMRVKVSHTGLYTYPDVVVVCGEARFEDDQRDTLLNPTLIVEVLSPSTEAYDRGKKFENYRSLPSLEEYVLISQDRRRIERYARQQNGNGWLLTEAGAGENLPGLMRLASVDCELTLAAVYDKVGLAPEAPAADG